MSAPPPQTHPYYADKPWLLDWVEGRGLYAQSDTVNLPVFPTLRPDADTVDPSALPLRRITVTRRMVIARAPYVGRPFIYMWPVGVDNLGRCLVGESRLVYLP